MVNGRPGLKREAHDAFFPPCVRIVLLLPMYSEIGQDEPTGMAEEVGGSACVGLQKGCVVVSEY